MGNGQPFIDPRLPGASAERWYQDGRPSGGNGVIVLPCGAGKTIVAIAAMPMVQQHTLILATNAAAVHQWVREILDKTTLTEPDQVGAYTGDTKQIRAGHGRDLPDPHLARLDRTQFAHLHLFDDHNWGLIVYDEVHLLPAPVFGATADLQGRRRLGLTATLVREDGREGDVFSLVGPKRYDLALADARGARLHRRGEVLRGAGRVHGRRVRCLRTGARGREVPSRGGQPGEARGGGPPAWRSTADDNVLIIGTYLDQLNEIARRFHAPLITGETPASEREILFEKFRAGRIKLLVVSKVANFSIDLPDANVAIQVSGSFGSRQEEAQRLGRILRPKKDGEGAFFYTVVTRDTKEQEFRMKRQLFLTEQGYRYYIQESPTA